MDSADSLRLVGFLGHSVLSSERRDLFTFETLQSWLLQQIRQVRCQCRMDFVFGQQKLTGSQLLKLRIRTLVS